MKIIKLEDLYGHGQKWKCSLKCRVKLMSHLICMLAISITIGMIVLLLYWNKLTTPVILKKFFLISSLLIIRFYYDVNLLMIILNCSHRCLLQQQLPHCLAVVQRYVFYTIIAIFHCVVTKQQKSQINGCVERDLLQWRLIKCTINICINQAKDKWRFKQISKL